MTVEILFLLIPICNSTPNISNFRFISIYAIQTYEYSRMTSIRTCVCDEGFPKTVRSRWNASLHHAKNVFFNSVLHTIRPVFNTVRTLEAVRPFTWIGIDSSEVELTLIHLQQHITWIIKMWRRMFTPTHVPHQLTACKHRTSVPLPTCSTLGVPASDNS